MRSGPGTIIKKWNEGEGCVEQFLVGASKNIRYSMHKSERLDEEFVRGIRSRPAVTTRDSIFVKVQKIIDHGSGRAAIKIKGKYFTV